MYAFLLVGSFALSGLALSFFGPFTYWLIPAFFSIRYLYQRGIPQLFPPTFLGITLGILLFSRTSVVVPVILWVLAVALAGIIPQIFKAATTLTQDLAGILLIYLAYGLLAGWTASRSESILLYAISVIIVAAIGEIPFFDRERGGFRVAV